jgi:LuxR family transcriptional regulator of csgAB operon
MTAENSFEEKSAGSLQDRVIYLVSPNRVQCELMASFLKQKTAAKVLIARKIHDIPLPEDESIELPRLILIDCLGKDPEDLLVELESVEKIVSSGDLVLLFNVSPGLRIEEEAVMRGVRGFFYIHDSLDRFEKGVGAVLDGELWISREIMTKFILENKRPRRYFRTDAAVLTRREIQILTMAASGATNTDIANKFYISPHTVKSHLYNIYKKIKVSNRLEAALWAAKNL